MELSKFHSFTSQILLHRHYSASSRKITTNANSSIRENNIKAMFFLLCLLVPCHWSLRSNPKAVLQTAIYFCLINTKDKSNKHSPAFPPHGFCHRPTKKLQSTLHCMSLCKVCKKGALFFFFLEYVSRFSNKLPAWCHSSPAREEIRTGRAVVWAPIETQCAAKPQHSPQQTLKTQEHAHTHTCTCTRTPTHSTRNTKGSSPQCGNVVITDARAQTVRWEYEVEGERGKGGK